MKNINALMLTALLMTSATSAHALSTENLSDSFDSCPAVTPAADFNLEGMLKEADDNLKQLMLNINKDSKLIDKQSETLAEGFFNLHGFIKEQKDLSQSKAQIQAKQKEVVAKNQLLLDDLGKVKDLFKSSESKLHEAYCSVVGLYDYFSGKSASAEDEQLLRALSTTVNELNGKKEKLDVILSDFDIFWGHLNRYIEAITVSSDYLSEFMHSVTTYENHTCQALKREEKGRPCPFKSEDIAALLQKQSSLLKTNETFLLAKQDLLKKSLGWKIDDEK